MGWVDSCQLHDLRDGSSGCFRIPKAILTQVYHFVCIFLCCLQTELSQTGLLFLGSKRAAALFKPCYFLFFCAADGPSKGCCSMLHMAKGVAFWRALHASQSATSQRKVKTCWFCEIWLRPRECNCSSSPSDSDSNYIESSFPVIRLALRVMTYH